MEAQVFDYKILEKVIYNSLDSYFKDKEKNNIAAISFNRLCELFFAKAKRDRKLSTLSTYKNIFNKHIKSSNLGCTYLYELNNNSFNDFLDILSRKSLSIKRVSDILVFINAVLHFAKSENLMRQIDFNIVRPKVIQKEMRVLNELEYSILETHLINNAAYDLTYLGVLIALKTGIRIGELCALKWADFDLSGGTINICRTVQRINTENKTKKTILHVDTPKSINSARTVPVTKQLLAFIRKFYNSNLDNCYLLTGTTKPMEPRTLQYRYKKILLKVGIEANFHALRHTFATHAVMKGIDIKTLSELLGHSTVKITLDKYVHSSIQVKIEQIEKIYNI